MKKNEHYFPTMEWIKDTSDPCGWRRVTYEGGEVLQGEGHEGVLPAAEDEQADGDMEVAAAGSEQQSG
jgi:hypothetical protein